MERYVETLKYGFRFQKFELDTVTEEVFRQDYDDSDWEVVRVPHDWAISEEFRPEHDPIYREFLYHGEKRTMVQTGRTGGLPIVGEGVYRRWIDIAEEDRERRIFLDLDGVMSTSHVYVNGVMAGGCHYGYKAYEVEITDYLQYGAPNLIAVYAQVRPGNGRWYSGSGIYRNLRLVKKDKVHICYSGVWVRQLYADVSQGIFEVSVDVNRDARGKTATVYQTDHDHDRRVSREIIGAAADMNMENDGKRSMEESQNGAAMSCMGCEEGFRVEIFSPEGNPIAECSTNRESLIFELNNPKFWDVDSPMLYTARVQLRSGDSETVKFGVRTSEFTKDGYFLNGRKLKLNGVCMHHDLGSLGAVVNVAAMRRQLEIMQRMGVNALRTSHNPPAPELLDLCDEMGILVIDEFFDEWTITKVTNGYAGYFEEHACKDVEDVIRHDRNHPCVILWSIGNELMEQEEAEGWRAAKLLSEVTHVVDPTRQVTAGYQRWPSAAINHLAFYVDVVGLNYKAYDYAKIHKQYPNLILLGSETESCLSTRSAYHFPAGLEHPAVEHEDLTINAYDLSANGIDYPPEVELAAQQDCPYVAGEFIWTGFDYLGESTPYFEQWPSRSAHYGVVDLAGIPKNRYYCYRSVWTDIPTLHVFPHWTWPGREGQKVPIHIFTNYDEVELFVNGISQGRRRHKNKEGFRDEARYGSKTAILEETMGMIERFRLKWDDVIYEPGEITAVAYDKDGRESERRTIKTAGMPYSICLEAYKEGLAADGDDVNYITASIVDKEGTLCENANLRLTFRVSGAGELLTTDAGDQRETEAFTRPNKKALGGMLVACVRSLKDVTGAVMITCEGEGLKSGKIVLQSTFS